jgi:hypothetical protein
MLRPLPTSTIPVSSPTEPRAVGTPHAAAVTVAVKKSASAILRRVTTAG